MTSIRSVLAVAGTVVFACSASAQEASIPTPAADLQTTLSAYDAAWNAADLGFAVVAFTEGASSDYGQYTPRSSVEFSDGQPLSLYVEPVGYSFSELNGEYSYKLTASYKLLNTSGQVLAEEDGFAMFSGTGRSKQRELSASLSFQFSGLPAGDYNLEATFTDEIGGKKNSFSLPFSVTATN